MNRDDILDAAAQVFRQKGFHGASMSDIATALDVQKPSLYHHVKSKQEILLALLDRALGMLVDHIAAISSQTLPPDEKLRQMIRGYLSALAANADLAKLYAERTCTQIQAVEEPALWIRNHLYHDVLAQRVSSGCAGNR